MAIPTAACPAPWKRKVWSVSFLPLALRAVRIPARATLREI